MALQQSQIGQSISCGEDARKHFLFDDGYINMNHGSFGAIPREVRDVQRHYQDACEQQPDIFIRYKYPPLLYASRNRIAKFLSAPVSSVVYVSNATTAMNTVLRNLQYEPGDVAIYFSTIYGAIEKTLLYLTETTPLQVHRIDLVYPLSDAAVVELFSAAVEKLRASGLTCKVAVFDIVSSLPGLRFPFEQLVRLCRQLGILSAVDGAHGVGHVPLDLTSIDPDFLTTNLHKWLHVPRPCAALYVAERNQKLIRTSLPTSHGFVPKSLKGGNNNNPLPSAGNALSEFELTFEFVGSGDSSAYLCVEAALDWRSRLVWNDMKGEEAILGYCMHQAREGGKLVADIMGTNVLENEEGTLACCMVNIGLPLDYDQPIGGGPLDEGKIVEVARWVEQALIEECGTFVAVIFHRSGWLVRLSAQVYLTLDDWRVTGERLREVCKRARNKDWKSA